MQDKITLPAYLVKELKEGWVYELSWDDETDEISLSPLQQFTIEEREKAKEQWKAFNGALPQTPKFKEK